MNRITDILEKHSCLIFLISSLILLIYIVAPTYHAWFNLEDFESIRPGMIESLTEVAQIFISPWPHNVPLATDNLGWSSGQLVSNLYRPLYAIIFYPDWKLWGWNAEGYRFTNALLYFLCAFWLFLLGKELFDKQIIGLMGGLFYLLNPVHFSTLFVINTRSESLLAVFALPAIIFYIKYRKTFDKKYYWISLAFLLFAVFSKEQAIAIPLVFLAYDILYNPSLGRSKIISGVIFPFIILIFYLVMRFMALGGLGSYSLLNPSYFSKFPFLIFKGLSSSLYYLLFARTEYFFYLQKYFLIIAAGFFILLAGIYKAAKFGKKEFLRHSAFLVLAYLLLIGLALPIFSLRFVFLPSAFFSLFLAYIIFLLSRKIERSYEKAVFAGCLVFIFALIIFWSFAWKDSAKDVVRASDYSLRVNNEMKNILPVASDNTRLIFLTKPASLRGLAILGNPEAWLRIMYGKNIDGQIIASIYSKNDFFQKISLERTGRNQYVVALPNEFIYTENDFVSGIFKKAINSFLCAGPASNQVLRFPALDPNLVGIGNNLENKIASFEILKGAGCAVKSVKIKIKDTYIQGAEPIYLFFDGKHLRRVY